ncbi:hypothetical protein NA57DRAFT_73172 [Rhizodiscina lignyota]|uniref:Uncharacterized protein n=1 Tax=Rhizodiscina lignyota TaxID=1504668 RepID=A0A9P4IHM5_9PEZI|nr:hypothetical protein NA57DRAFT_73172 [Rhizodiscina lignyota]
MAALKFSELSTDLKTLIVSHILRPTDLVAVCLTSKQLHEIAVRFLYRDVPLDIGCPHDSSLAAFLNSRNIGLPYIRKLDLYLADIPDKCGQLEQAHFATRMILEFLPENILERFSWHPWQNFSAGNLELLYRKQRRLKNLEGISLDADPWDKLNKIPNLDELFNNVRKVYCFPDNRDVLTFCGELLRRTKRIESLNIHTSFCDDSDHQHYINPRELNDTATEPGLITSTVFSHMLPFESCTPLNITKLDLQKVNLRFCANTYARVINFRGLRDLSVQRCPGVDTFLSEISKSSNLPVKLLDFSIKHKDNDEDDGMSALDGFLCLVSGIESLMIDFSNSETLPQVDSIVRHSKTLKTLIVHAADGDWGSETTDELIYDANDFKKICEQCSAIEELSIATPDRSITDCDPQQFNTWGEPYLKLANLRTLHFTVWPTNKPSSAAVSRDTYIALLQVHATRLFDTSLTANPRLNIIAFGTSDKTYDRRDSPNLVIFAKGIAPRIVGNSRKVKGAVDEDGKKAYAQEVGYHDRRYIEQKSECLELDLGANKVKMPVKDLWDDD